MRRPNELPNKTALLPVYDEFIDAIVQGNPEAIIAFRPSEATQNRAYALLDKEREGTLTDDETAELDTYVQLEHILQIAALRARKALMLSAA